MTTIPNNQDILISGAGVAGPVLAYWLEFYGFRPTIVERASSPRRTGGHAVDLFGPAVEIAERMGLSDQLAQRRTGNRRIEMSWGNGTRTVDMDVDRVAALTSDRNVEIMRDDLTELLFDATPGAEYRFSDSIAALTEHDENVEVTFDSGERRRFDLVIGADGLHSAVRRLAFGPESDYARFIGAHLAVYSLPDLGGPRGTVRMYMGPGRLVAFYPVRGSDEMRAVFVACTEQELDYHYRDVARQRQLVRESFFDLPWHVPHLLAELDDADPFYFDSITQVEMPSWSRGRVALVGDAAYSPGPAVGGGTSLAMLGAYQLAGQLATAHGDFREGFARYEQALAPQVENARGFGRAAVAKLAPNSPGRIWANIQVARLLSVVPGPLLRRLARNRPQKGPILDQPLPVFAGAVPPDALRSGASSSRSA